MIHNNPNRPQTKTRSTLSLIPFFLLVCLTWMGCGKQKSPEPLRPLTDLHTAAATGDLRSVQDHIAAGSDLNQRNQVNQSTPLMAACVFGQLPVANALLEAGVDLDVKNTDGSTALFIASFFCHPEIVQSLLSHGANPTIRNNTGSTALAVSELPWEMIKPIYDFVGGALASQGLVLDYERIQATRPKIAEILRKAETNAQTNKTTAVYEKQSVTPIVRSGNEKYLSEDSNYIFNQEKLHTFEINLPESNLARIDQDPTQEEYVEGSLTFEGETISPVGIRYKGSRGAWFGGVSDFNFVNPSGHKISTKLSMKIKLNWTQSSPKFYGLKKLQFHSLNLDPSQMHERLGYWLFREMDVHAPRSVHAKLYINGKYSGLYALTEQIDGRFTRNQFKDGTGNLYKEIWPIDMNGNPQTDEDYLRALQTNEDDNPSFDLIREFAEAISKSPDSNLQDVIQKWMNIDEIIAFAVVDRSIRNDDGPFHWYCFGGQCMNHNYYWYEDPTLKKFHLIPWDLDIAFQNIISETNPMTPIADAWGQITSDCNPFEYGLFKIPQRSAACDKLTQGWTLYRAEFKQTLTRFLEGPFSEESVLTQLQSWEEQIRQATLEASQTHSDAISIPVWEAALNDLKNQLTHARNHPPEQH